MDILDLMTADHNLIAKLFDVIKEETDRQESFGIFEEIRRELDLHFQAEEASCYPIFLKLPTFKVLVGKSYNDHQDIRKLLNELCNMPDTRDGIAFQNRILELKNHVESHVIEEERDLFELVRQELDAPERERLGNLFSLAKSQFEESVA
jgi:hemerythrin superfamily protein